MDKLRTLIIDDEEIGRSTLKHFLAKYCPEAGLIEEAASVAEAVARIEANYPSLVFLDINMPGENGLSLFNRIPAPRFHTIFVTASDEYALQAIKHHALDYILKPISINELIDAVKRAKSLLDAAETTQQIAALMQSVQQAKKQPDKLALPVMEGFVYVQLSDVVRCEAEGNYTYFHFANRGKLLVCRTLGSYEELLKDNGFIRVHHHHLINKAHIEKYQRGRGGIVVMSDKAEVIVSQRKKDEFLRHIYPDALI